MERDNILDELNYCTLTKMSGKHEWKPVAKIGNWSQIQQIALERTEWT